MGCDESVARPPKVVKHGQLKAVCVQFSPSFMEVRSSMAKADALLEQVANEEMDLIVLPEMSFTGYCFKSREEVLPFTETPQDIRSAIDNLDLNDDVPNTLKWALRTSKKFNSAWVVVGFPERTLDDKFFNSAMIVNYALKELHIVRKVLLFGDDKNWCDLESSVSGIEYNY